MALIYHITSKSEWSRAQEAGFYTAPSLPKENFIHCSLSNQVVRVANNLFKGQANLVLLVIDESKVKHRIVYEDLYNLNEDFPHIYGEINLDCVVDVLDFPPDVDGNFQFPTR